jgi:hypothetical protein
VTANSFEAALAVVAQVWRSLRGNRLRNVVVDAALLVRNLEDARRRSAAEVLVSVAARV